MSALASGASRLLEDFAFKAAAEGLRADWLEEIANTPDDAADRRERLYRNVKALEAVESRLRWFVTNGKIEARR